MLNVAGGNHPLKRIGVTNSVSVSQQTGQHTGRAGKASFGYRGEQDVSPSVTHLYNAHSTLASLNYIHDKVFAPSVELPYNTYLQNVSLPAIFVLHSTVLQYLFIHLVLQHPFIYLVLQYLLIT